MDFIQTEINGINENSKFGYNWIDVTDEFIISVQDLKLGELLHDSIFGLFEAMSAIEMMDPKMDAGMLCNRGTKRAKSFDQAVNDKTLKLADISNTDLIAIIDNSLACVVSWLEGHSLAQTVFTNLYLHKPYAIEDPLLKCFCFSIYKLLEIIKEYIHRAIVYEEEDFQSIQYGYHLNPDISRQRMVSMLHQVEENLHKKARLQNAMKIDSCEVEELIALYARMKFIRCLYQALILFIQRKDDRYQINLETQKLSKQKLKTASDMLHIIKKTVNLGMINTDNDSGVPGFEPLINQRLLPPTFPRYSKIKARHEAMCYLETMMDRFQILSNIQGVTALNQALEFFIEFSKTSPCILSRSALQLLYSGSQGMLAGSNTSILCDILKDATRQFISPPALTSKIVLQNQQAKFYLDSFFAHCTLPFGNFLQLCGHNRARQRDKLAHLLEEFANLQDEAERVDAHLHNILMNNAPARPHLACFSTWILYHTLRIMIMFLLSGFELELYSIHEYYYIYWYLYEFLYGWLVSALTRADNFLAEQEYITELQKSKNFNKKKNKYKKKIRPYNRDSLYYQTLQNLCGGYYKTLMGFRMDGKLQMPHPQFDNEQVRYDHRFAPFQNLVTPPPVHYPEFKELTSPSRYPQQPIDSIYLYFAGCKHFHQARQLLENIASPDNEINELLKIAKTNFVVLKLLAGGHKKDSCNPPEFDFSLNKYFPIIKLL